MTHDELHDVVRIHGMWLEGHHEGVMANLSGADLAGAELNRANLSWANLAEAELNRANLSWADLSRANLAEDLVECVPVIPQIHRALLDAITADGHSLDMHEWHTCNTNHCRAGWVIVLAGEAGKKLEAMIGTNAAAALIYMASDPSLERVPNWFADNESAMDDIRRLAESCV